MTAQDNKALVRRIFEEIWNQGNLARVDELFVPEHVGYDQTGPFHGLQCPFSSIEAGSQKKTISTSEQSKKESRK
jgi:hypothetical protein